MLLWTFGALCAMRGQQPAAPASRHVAFFVPHAVLWAGRSAVIPLCADHAADTDELFPVALSDAGFIEILRPPKVLSGETTGFMRVRALRPGHLRLLVHGEAALDMQVKNDPAGPAYARVDAESPRPRIVTPVPQACVWGQFTVGVEVFDANPAVGVEPRVQLRLPGGKLLDPVAHTTPEQGPARHYQFDVPADDVPAGHAKLVAVSAPVGFSDAERAGRAPGSLWESEPLDLTVVAPRPTQIWTGECEDPAVMGVTKALYGPARPPASGISLPKVVADPAASGGQTVTNLYRESAWSLPFIVKEAGDYQMMIRTRGDFAIGAFPTASLYLNDAEVPVGSVRLAGSKYHRLPIGTPVHLDAGPELLSIEFRNNAAAGKEARNLYVDSYEIVRVGNSPVPPPSVPKVAAGGRGVAVPPVPAAPVVPTILGEPPDFRPAVAYPANGAAVFGADAVVARVPGGGIVRPAWVDILVDGQPQGVRSQSPSPADPVLLPFVVRQIAPGHHRLAVRVADYAGHVTDSPVQNLTVLPAAPAVRGPYDRAVFLLDRLAFGPDSKELIAILTMNESAWLENRLNSGFDTPAEQAALRIACRNFPRLEDSAQTEMRAVSQWVCTENPVRARFTAWAENHFSTWIEKTKAAPKWREHLDFCRVGVAPFGDLLNVSAHSPAMIFYLDQMHSYAKRLNENYAREIMELHTLGVHGGYAQSDVTTLAGVLNGWTSGDEAMLPDDAEAVPGLVYSSRNEAGLTGVFRFDPLLNDGKARRVFGLDFPAAEPAARYDQIHLALEMLAAHPGTAEHVCRQLAEHYVGVQADDALVRTLAVTYLETGGDMRPVLRTLASSAAFWNSAPKMATPFDYALRIARLCRSAVIDLGGNPDVPPKPEQIVAFLKKSGMGLFERVTPDGYPQNSASYMDSNALLQRWHFMESMVEPLNRLVPTNWRTPPAPALVPAANEEPGRLGGSATEDAAQRFVDLAAVRLTGRLLAPGSNQAARELLGNGTPDQMRQTLLLISLLPETSLR